MRNEHLTPREHPIAVGDPAPQFTLLDQHNDERSLESFLSQGPVVLSFYPFDFTGTCTAEMQCLSADIERFTAQDTTIVGISCDSPACHKVFAETHNLPITLLSDLHRDVCRAFGFYWPKMNVASRGTVLINPDATVAWVQARELGTALTTHDILSNLV